MDQNLCPWDDDESELREIMRQQPSIRKEDKEKEKEKDKEKEKERVRQKSCQYKVRTRKIIKTERDETHEEEIEK